MVPIFNNGDPHSAKVCIDIFEFPNEACELPFVWGTPLEAENVCHLQGKRLCADKEWNMACSADPLGVKAWPYAYGEKLDMTLCNDNTPKRMAADGKTWLCNTHDAQASWSTCSTDTEPSGAFPRCRSRLGVFDQHGNVAEEMFRKDGEAVWTQLKGSAWFYTDVGREPGKPAWHPERESYPDTCNYDPRWHVEELKKSLHVNYHLGFRCCKDTEAGKDAGAPK
jgi:formylglycine-generating enzyme required for sulfatase activity